MTTTELIELLIQNEKGGMSHKSREISLTINGKYMPNPQITLSSTGDGICGAEIDLDIDGDFMEEQEPKDNRVKTELNGIKTELEPCEDCISRQAVIQHICEDKFCYKENCKGNIYKRCPDIMWVYDLPSVNPQEPKTDRIEYGTDGSPYKLSISNGKEYEQEPKTGHWIFMEASSGRESWKCSVCGRRARGKLKDLPYCHCGAKMEG